jgi:hypothetical protein
MSARKVTDEQLIAATAKTRSTTALAQQFGMSTRAIATRVRKLGIPAAANWKEVEQTPIKTALSEATGRMRLDMQDGCAVVFSDAHFRHDAKSTANRALVKMLPDLKPKLVVCNGDAIDGNAISRHAPIFGEQQVRPAIELSTCQERLTEISDASRGAVKAFTIGNHDVRLHNYIAANASMLNDMRSLDIRHLFPEWRFCWSLFINDDTIVKHRFRNGQYAPANNVRGALGMNFVTGHLHSMKAIPLSAYSDRTFYGVDSGMLADPEWETFAYREDSPADWRSGFVVLTWWRGRLLWPEFCNVLGEGVVEFRGQIIEV